MVVGVVREWPWPGLGCSGRGSGRWSGRGSRVAVWCVVGSGPSPWYCDCATLIFFPMARLRTNGQVGEKNAVHMFQELENRVSTTPIHAKKSRRLV